MKKNLFLTVGILFTLLQGCYKDDEIHVEPDNNKIKSSIVNSTGSVLSALTPPTVSRDELVVRYKTTMSPSMKIAIRKENHVKKYKLCSCGDESLELWTVDTDSISAEGAVNNLQPNGSVQGDFQFDFKAFWNYHLPLGELSNLKDKVVPFNYGKSVNIAVIDTGVDYNLFSKPFLYNNPDDANCENEISGWDFVNDDPDIRDDHGHGTLITKLITSELDASKIDYQILAVKAFNKNGDGTYWDMVCAMSYVIKKEIPLDIINMSFGWQTLPEQDIFKDMIDSVNDTTLIITSAGNEGEDTDGEIPHFPSGYDSSNILTVGGYKVVDTIQVTASGHIYSGIEFDEHSNYGTSSIDMVASYDKYRIPIEFPSKTPISFYGEGTSFSAAYITSKAATIFKKESIPKILKSELLNTAYTSDVIKKGTKEGKVILKGEKFIEEE